MLTDRELHPVEGPGVAGLGFGEQMRAISLQYVPTAILSRQILGTLLRAAGFFVSGKDP